MAHQLLILQDFQGLEPSVQKALEKKYSCTLIDVSSEQLDTEALQPALEQCHLALCDAQIEFERLEEVVEHCRAQGVAVFILSESSIDSFGTKPSFFLRKPFSVDELIGSIESILDDLYLQESA